MIELKKIRKLLESQNESDIILGVEYLNIKYKGKRCHIVREINKIMFYEDMNFRIDAFFDKFNLYISAGSFTVYEIEPENTYESVLATIKDHGRTVIRIT